MGFLTAILNFLKSLFNTNSPESVKKQELKKVENDLKMLSPVLYKNGMVQPNFAELLRILYENSKPIDDILSVTTNSSDQKKAWRFRRELVITGFSPESKQRLNDLSYENRLDKILTSNLGPDAVFANQRKHLEDLIKDLNSRELISIDRIIAQLDQLSALCKYNFLSAIRTFDPNYDNFVVNYKPNFASIVPEALEGTFADLYFLGAGFTISTSLASAVLAAAQMKKMSPLTDIEKGKLLSNLKKINSLLKKNLTPSTLKNFAMLAAKETNLDLKLATYKAETRQQFANFLEDQFRADEQRLKSELKDRNIENELKALFGEMPMMTLKGYNNDINRNLKENTPSSFLMITPMQVLKTFVKNFIPETTMSLLNNIVVEGFFNNNDYKSEFAQSVFEATELSTKIDEFEVSFGQGKPYDPERLAGYIRDSHKNAEFIKDLVKLVDTVNVEARRLIEEEASIINVLTRKVQDMISDSKKVNPEMISNIKVLSTTARNKDAFDNLEKNFPTWKNFLTVMKNYVIIGEEKKGEGKKN